MRMGASLRTVPAASWATGAILAAGYGLSLTVNWPGHLSYDSVIQLLEGRTRVYSGWHPPVMSWLLGAFDALVPGTALFVLLNTTLLYGALFTLLFLVPAPRWVAAPVALLAIITPQLLLFPGVVWKDVLFAAAMVAGFVLIANAAVRWHAQRLRFALIAGALALLSLAALARQNGMILAPFAALAIGWSAARHAPARKFTAAALYTIGWLVVMSAAVVGSEAALELRSNGESSPLAQLRLLQIYDLAGALAHDPHLALEEIHDDDPELESILRNDAAQRYTPASEEPLANLAPLQKELENVADDTVPLQWRQFVLSHPLLYLRLRWDAFRFVFFTPDIVAARPALTGVSGPRDVMRKLALPERQDARDKALADYTMFVGRSFVLRHWFWAVVTLGGLVALLRRRDPADIAIAAMLAGALAFTASFFFLSLVGDYRYLYPLDAAGIAGLLYVALSFPLRLD